VKGKKFSWKQVFALSLSIFILTSLIWMAFSNPDLTSVIEAGSMNVGYSYIIGRDGSTYYARNGKTGAIDYSSSNASGVIHNVIDNGLEHKTISLPYYYAGYATISAPCGSIYFQTAQYELDTRIQIPLGSRIKIEGDGYSVQPINSGVNGGTQFRSSDADGVFIALDYGTLVNGSDVSSLAGSSIIIRDVEFVQTVEQTSNSSIAVNLNGMVQGLLQNVAINSYQHWGSQWQGYGLAIYNYGYSDMIQFLNVQVYGFYVAMSLTSDHLVLKGVGVGASHTALQLKPMPYVSIDELHIFQTNKTIQVAATSEDWAYMHNLTQVITNLYLEQVGTTDNSTVWLGNHGMRIVIEKCQATKIRPTVWTPYGFDNRSLWEFHKVNVNSVQADADFTSPEFPEAYQPAIANNTDILAYNPCMTWLSIDGGTVSAIYVCGIDTGLTSGSFLLRPKDYVKVVYTVEPTTWIWRNFDVDADGILMLMRMDRCRDWNGKPKPFLFF